MKTSIKTYQYPIPYVIYADFEALIQSMPIVQSNQVESYTENFSFHEPCEYAYIIVRTDGKQQKTVQVYRGPDAAEHFLESILKEKEELT